MKPKVINFLEHLQGGTLQLHHINFVHVVLIPKKGEAKEVGNFRPISVLNTSVKILSKVLANRLRNVC